jgi:hypothetical protein
MIGAIRVWDVLFHPVVTIRCFGWKIFWQALQASPNCTFLSLLTERSVFGGQDSEISDVLRQCINLELRAKQIYVRLADTAAESRSLAQFFVTLAQQEQNHADLLELCSAASRHAGWRLHDLPVWRKELARLDQELHEAEVTASSVCDVNDAMRLVVKLESSEINRVFEGVIGASNSAFVKSLQPFHCAMQLHMNYLVTRVSELAPDLWSSMPPVTLSCSSIAE